MAARSRRVGTTAIVSKERMRAANAFRRARSKSSTASAKPLPPIKVHGLGGVYFVRDGNHRVSVAQAQGWAFIDAEVVRVRTDVALEPGMSLKDMAAAASRARSAQAAAA